MSRLAKQPTTQPLEMPPHEVLPDVALQFRAIVLLVLIFPVAVVNGAVVSLCKENVLGALRAITGFHSVPTRKPLSVISVAPQVILHQLANVGRTLNSHNTYGFLLQSLLLNLPRN